MARTLLMLMYLVRRQPVLAQALQGRRVPQLLLLLVEEAKSLSAVLVLKDKNAKLARKKYSLTELWRKSSRSLFRLSLSAAEPTKLARVVWLEEEEMIMSLHEFYSLHSHQVEPLAVDQPPLHVRLMQPLALARPHPQVGDLREEEELSICSRTYKNCSYKNSIYSPSLGDDARDPFYGPTEDGPVCVGLQARAVAVGRVVDVRLKGLVEEIDVVDNGLVRVGVQACAVAVGRVVNVRLERLVKKIDVVDNGLVRVGVQARAVAVGRVGKGLVEELVVELVEQLDVVGNGILRVGVQARAVVVGRVGEGLVERLFKVDLAVKGLS